VRCSTPTLSTVQYSTVRYDIRRSISARSGVSNRLFFSFLSLSFTVQAHHKYRVQYMRALLGVHGRGVVVEATSRLADAHIESSPRFTFIDTLPYSDPAIVVCVVLFFSQRTASRLQHKGVALEHYISHGSYLQSDGNEGKQSISSCRGRYYSSASCHGSTRPPRRSKVQWGQLKPGGI